MAKRKYECGVCKRSFDSFQALGGHALEHRQPGSQDDRPQDPDVGRVAEGDDIDEAQQINEYLDRGFTLDHLVKQLGFKPSTVRQEIAKRLAQAGNSNEDGESPEETHLILPDTVGTGKEQRIVPEYILTQLEGLDGGHGISPLQAILLLQAARRMEREDLFEEVKMLQGLAEAQSKVTTSQLSVFREAKSESAEVAREAAADVARQLIPEIQGLRSQITAGAAPDPVTRMMNLMQSIPQMVQMGQQMMGMMGMRLPGMPVGGPAPPGSQPELQPQQVGQSTSQQSPSPPGGEPPTLAGPQLANTPQPSQTGPQPGAPGEATSEEIREAFGD